MVERIQVIYCRVIKTVCCVQVNILISELKSDAVKERHWKQLMRRLGVKWVLSDMTLGHIWEIDLVRNENTIRDVLGIAQGEKALEEFLKQVWQCS